MGKLMLQVREHFLKQRFHHIRLAGMIGMRDTEATRARNQRPSSHPEHQSSPNLSPIL